MSETNRIEYKQEFNNDVDTRQNYKLAELKELLLSSLARVEK